MIKNYFKYSRKQNGFTLVELLVALAITGLIMAGMTTSVFQLFTVTQRSNDHMTIIRHLDITGSWLSNDIQMANEPPIWDTDTHTLTINQTRALADPTDPDSDITDYIVTYNYSTVTGSLTRTELRLSDNYTQTSLIAEYISGILFEDDLASNELSGAVDIKIIITLHTQTEERLLHIKPRISST
ncbi:type II secretion system protein J [Dehalococcoides mccartyi]|jgi:prepilin-type N-terminal cleavage/methylation domain-containing protein|uniref:Tfp pilus assembly protein n=1 Tax=Dehalococcoides mccartyi (strain VS) TaxID=311424 RepID=D2BIV0_DEHMV|nr:prepilin-type N-terminal cleavage/methylation domain-containing protein [Dehalococcoides mccartyi]ACZ62250.1 Tfp pilus assembly protein [Dehalococcoides mccartyi VS]AHB13964.1 type IV pilus assembly protein PilW [Dehalococcoides mccartyi GY50]AII58307.1 secretion system protein [Dehalococcoides mccartyi CG1]APH12883.1 secretion system protein [Dehalococcoides mccartyi]